MNTISVALCTYNGEKHIAEQIKSILSQTRPPEEIVLCDDASGDGTLEAARIALAPFKGRLLLHRNPGNLGFRANFQQALTLSSGDIICLADQDDVWEPEKIEALALALAEQPGKALAFHDAALTDDRLRPLAPSFWQAMSPPFRPGPLLAGDYSRLFYSNVVQGAACALRRELLTAALPIPECAYHDEWLALAALTQGGLLPLPRKLLRYRQGSNAIGAPAVTLREKLRHWTQGLGPSAAGHRRELQRRLAVLEEYQRRFGQQLPDEAAAQLKGELLWQQNRLRNLQKPLRTLLGLPGCLARLPLSPACREWAKDLLSSLYSAHLHGAQGA